MQPLPVVERLDPLEDRASCLGPGLEVGAPDELVLEIREEALRAGVVVAGALAAHAREHPGKNRGQTTVPDRKNRGQTTVS